MFLSLPKVLRSKSPLTYVPKETNHMRFSFYFLPLLFIASTQAGLAQAGGGVVTGKVTSAQSGEPLPFVNVIVQESDLVAQTDFEGVYRIEGLNPGLYNLEYTTIGYKPLVLFEVEVSTARVAFRNVAMEESTIVSEAAEIKASGFTKRDEAPVSLSRIGVNEVKRNPGGNRDISQAIRSLPGVASTPSFRNDIIIRGGAPNENRFYIDGIEIPNINHFATQGSSGGPVGMINVDFIDEVNFYSGAFPAGRGNALSSVLEFGFKDGRSDLWTANAVVGASDIGLTLEGPTGENSSLVASARRSYLQFLFDAIGLPFLPTYNDFQFKWQNQLNTKNKLTVLGIGAIDNFALNLGLASDTANPDFENNVRILDFLSVNSQWNYAIGATLEHFGEQGITTLVTSRNMLNNEAFKHINNDEDLAKTFDYESQEIENKARVEHKRFWDDGSKLNVGVAYEYAKYNNSTFQQAYSFAADTLVDVSLSSDLDLHKYGAFAQASRPFFERRLLLSLGVRMDGTGWSSSMANPLDQFSPRFSASYGINERLSWNFNTGIYHQLPSYTVMGFVEEGALVNRDNDLRYIRNKQLVTGLRYEIPERNSQISVEGFYKAYDRYPFSVDKQISLANLGADFGVIGNEEVTSTSTGRAYGAEFMYQQRLFKGFYGILSYTFVRSEFTGSDPDEFIASAWDSRHLISVTGGKKFKRNWEMGARFLFSAGTPFTPYDVDASVQIPVWDVFSTGLPDYARLNQERLTPYYSLDIRVDKKWYFDKWSLNLYFDIQNVTNFQTPAPDFLDVEKDALGNPIPDANNPGSYTPLFIEQVGGTILPTVGLILEI